MLLCKCVSWLISEVVGDDVVVVMVVIVFVFVVGCVVVELLPVAEDEALELGMDVVAVVVGSVRTETVVRVERVGMDGHGHGDDGA